jgi:hypothetical protein
MVDDGVDAIRRRRHRAGVSITAIVENDMIRLPADVHLPDGTRVRLEPIVPSESSRGWPAGYFARTAGMLAGERLERPEQGTLEQREVW